MRALGQKTKARRWGIEREEMETSGRPSEAKVNTGNWVVTSAPVYDELGRLSDKRLHASNYDGVSAVTLSSSFNYLQSVDYTYNIRNWLTGINDPTTCTLQSGDQQQDLFRMQLNYETALNGSTPQYNGNISSMQWNTYLNGVCGQRQLYMFSYDAANRLTAAAHRNWNGTAWTDPLRYSESGITYDLNGNIKTYNRKGLISTGVYGDIDLLAYTYGDTQRPDRLTKVVDTGNAGKGFKYNPPATGNHYAYDGNGNMTTDNHKKTTITYNYLNLPAVITFTDGTNRKIEWVYNADGTKLSKTTSTGAAVNGTKDYVNGIEYNGTNLEAIYFAEGRITPNGTAFFYEYTIKDHLGNTRITFRANGASLTTLQENHYYPFGLEMEGAWQAQVGAENAYQYNGKELNEDFGLNWYDYGARWYDAAVGRWWSVDPIATKHPNWSPYNYTFNNPIIFVDPDGKDAILVIKPGENGANGSITVQLTFNYSTKFTGDSKFIESAKSSFVETWGNGKIEDKGNNTFSGASFNDVEIDGQKYNVTYELAFNSVENTVKATDPGENRLFTISADKPTSSHYGDGKLDYKSSQENLSKGTTFGHELAHVMGLGHNNNWSDDSGKKSISSVDVSKRDVIMKDIVETTQPAVKLAGDKGGTVILTTWRGTSNLNKVSQEDGGQKREAQYPAKGN